MSADTPLTLEESLEDIASRVRSCDACALRGEAITPVPGEGNPHSGIVFIGRNPGKVEDREGRPFVGPSGVVLEQFLAACGLRRNDIYLLNIVNCYTLEDREPETESIGICTKLHLRRYLEVLQPRLVVTLGALTARYVCGVKNLKDMHGNVYRHKAGFYVIPTYHPAAVLRDYKMRFVVRFDIAQIRAQVAALGANSLENA